METVDMIRWARPEVADPTADEFAAIRASFERRAVERPSRLRAFVRRLSGRQLLAMIAALMIVPAGAVAVAEIIDEGRSDQLAIALPLADHYPAIVQGFAESCRELRALGVEAKPCAELMHELGEGDFLPGP